MGANEQGAGARSLGLDGELVDDDFVALMAGVDPRTGSALGSRHTPRNVRGFDVTCSAPKSLSDLFAVGDDHTRREVRWRRWWTGWNETLIAPAITYRQPVAIEQALRRHDVGKERRVMSGPELATALRRQERLVQELRTPGITRTEHQRALTALDALDLKRQMGLQHIEKGRADFAAAKAVLDRYPRGIDRLLHRSELAQAEKTLDESRLKLRELRRDVRDIDTRIIEINDDLRPRLAHEAQRPGLETQLGQVQHALEIDRQNRCQALTGLDLAMLVDYLGPEPEGPAGELWRDTAGRITQHRAAFAITDGTLLGPQPSYFAVDAYATSHRATINSIDQLDRALGRVPVQELEIESLGLSL